MSRVFLPSCKLQARWKEPSAKLLTYLQEKEQVKKIGCCKVFCEKVSPKDQAIVVCNNCAAIMEESSPIRDIEFAWEIIDRDEAFPFPDYHGERMTIQDCLRAYEKRNVQNAIRSLLRKMNINVVELENNFEKADFCGPDLLEPCTEAEQKLAPRRYVMEGGHMYKPLPTPEDEDAWLLSNELKKRGVSVPPAMYPAVPKGKARLRFCVISEHKPEQIEKALDILESTAREFGIELPRRNYD